MRAPASRASGHAMRSNASAEIEQYLRSHPCRSSQPQTIFRLNMSSGAALRLLSHALVLQATPTRFTALAPFSDSQVVQGGFATAQWAGASGDAWRNMTITLMTGSDDEPAPIGGAWRACQGKRRR